MGNWRYISIKGKLPQGADKAGISQFLNDHDDILYFADTS
jgi:hypothetical protein